MWLAGLDLLNHLLNFSIPSYFVLLVIYPKLLWKHHFLVLIIWVAFWDTESTQLYWVSYVNLCQLDWPKKKEKKKHTLSLSVGGERNSLSSLGGKIKCTVSLPFPVLFLSLSLSLSLLAILEVQKQSREPGTVALPWRLQLATLLCQSANGHGYAEQNIQGARNQLTRHAMNMKREWPKHSSLI